jgi:hypothetical protein
MPNLGAAELFIIAALMIMVVFEVTYSVTRLAVRSGVRW